MWYTNGGCVGKGDRKKGCALQSYGRHRGECRPDATFVSGFSNLIDSLIPVIVFHPTETTQSTGYGLIVFPMARPKLLVMASVIHVGMVKSARNERNPVDNCAFHRFVFPLGWLPL
jgi:hypothetical protein